MSNYLLNINKPISFLFFTLLFFVIKTNAQINIYYPYQVRNIQEALNIAIQSPENIRASIFINVSVRDQNGELYVAYKTPFFELPTSNMIIKSSDFPQLLFSQGNMEKIKDPPPGRYLLETSLINYSTQQVIAQTQTSVWIDTLKQENSRKNSFRPGMTIRNSTEINLPRDSLTSFRDFTRVDLLPSVTVMDIPVKGEIIFTKYIGSKGYHFDNLNFGVDVNSIQEIIRNKIRQTQREILETADEYKTDQLNNIGYDKYTQQKEDWNKMIGAYRNDSVRKIVHKVQSLDTFKIEKNIHLLDSASNRLEARKTVLMQDLLVKKDELGQLYSAALEDSVKTLQKNINALDNQVRNIRRQISSEKENLVNVHQYKELIQHKKALDTLILKDPQKILEEHLNVEDLINEQLMSRKYKFLSGIKELNAGTNTIRWSNQAASFMRLKGLNFSYQVGDVNIAAYAGLASNLTPSFFVNKRDSVKEIKAGIQLSYNLRKRSVLSSYFAYAKVKTDATDSLNTNSTTYLPGLTYTWTAPGNFSAFLEYGMSFRTEALEEQQRGYIAVGRLQYENKYTNGFAEIIYKNKEYVSNNYFLNPSDNLIASLQYGQSFFKKKLTVNLNNIYTHNFHSDTLYPVRYTNNLNLAFNINPISAYYIIISGNIFHLENDFDAYNSELTQPSRNSRQYLVNISTGYNKTFDNIAYSISASVQQSQKNMYNYFSDKQPILEINAINYFTGKHLNTNLFSSVTIRNQQNVSVEYNFLNISQVNDDTSSTTQHTVRLQCAIPFKTFRAEAGMLYQKTFLAGENLHSYAPNARISSTLFRKLTCDLYYQYHYNQIFLYNGVKKHNHLLRFNVSYTI